MHLDILYARENALARSLPRSLTQGFTEIWAWGSRQPLAGAYRSEIAEDAVNFLIDFRQVKDLATLPSLSPGGWFHFSGPSKISWGKDRRTASVVITRPDGVIRGSIRAECMLTNTSWVNLKGKVDNTFILGRLESVDRFDLYAAGHVNLFPGITEDASENFRMMGHVIRNGSSETMSDGLTNFVSRLISTFADTLLYERGWTLVGASHAVKEKDCQTLFGIIAKYATGGVLVDRETETGLGPVDFIISGFGERHGVEFKIFKGGLSTLRQGLDVQLPTYMKAKNLDRGWFVVILSGPPGPTSDVADMETKLRALNKLAEINVRVVDARPQVSASRRDNSV
ncbi:hypothetical protein [Streptomyces sp. NBC_00103]|uniref:hypothetical protein n=1 Tax=Streptomyces sp. NBC_00103 TaxID=2975653 RepID=UPI00224FE6F3|nr:hypothetical protein [Streptomyces sp. NBC_00103]MCX5367966.1 hypothetical protein [Streptomyces sp. NBC_00103]